MMQQQCDRDTSRVIRTFAHMMALQIQLIFLRALACVNKKRVEMNRVYNAKPIHWHRQYVDVERGAGGRRRRHALHAVK